MKVDWKHRKAEREVGVLLRRAAMFDADLVRIFPRSVPDLLAASFSVAFESHKGLRAARVVEVLGDRYGVDHRELLTEGDVELAGYTFARGEFAVVFSESAYGPQFERFTQGHEAGHLVTEYWPLLEHAQHPSLFDRSPEPVLYARRDPPGHIFLGDTSGTASRRLPADYEVLRADHAAWVREVVANGFAAELLAPHVEVRRLIDTLPPEECQASALQAHFGLSRRAAEVRLSDLGLRTSSDDAVQFLSF